MSRPRNDHLSKSYKEYLSKKTKLLAYEDEDEEEDNVTCHMCLQDFWNKTYLFDHLQYDHGISDPEAYEKKRRVEMSKSHGIFNSKPEIINHFENCYPAHSQKDSKQLGGHEKRKRGRPPGSKNQIKFIAMKRNVSNSVQTIDLDKSNIPKRGCPRKNKKLQRRKKDLSETTLDDSDNSHVASTWGSTATSRKKWMQLREDFSDDSD